MKKVFIGRLSIEKEDALVGYMTNKWNNLGTASLATKICRSEDSVSKTCQNRGGGALVPVTTSPVFHLIINEVGNLLLSDYSLLCFY